MPHFQNVANVWVELVGRKDQTFLFWETLGQLWAKIHRNEISIDADLLESIILIKNLLDRQRTLLSWNTDNVNTHSESVFSVQNCIDCMQCLCEIAHALKSVPDISQATYQGVLRILRSAFFSGFRTAILALEHSSDKGAWGYRLGACTHQWQTGELIDDRWCRSVFQGVVNDMLERNTNGGSNHEHKPLDMRDRGNWAEIYNISEPVEAAVTCIASSNCPYSYRSTLVLLDARFLLTSAFIEQLTENRLSNSSVRPSGSSPAYTDPTSSTELEQLVRQWKAMSKAIQIGNHNGQVPEILKSELYNLNNIEPVPPCEDISLDEIRDWSAPRFGIPALFGSSDALDSLYSTISIRLKHRNMATSTMAIQNISARLDESTRTWLPPSSRIPRFHAQSSGPPFVLSSHNPVYILNCEDVHVIDYDHLDAQILDAAAKLALKNFDEIIEVDFHCPFHNANPPMVSKARLVTPLAEISSVMQTMTRDDREKPRTGGESVPSGDDDIFSEPEKMSEISSPTGSRVASSGTGTIAAAPIILATDSSPPATSKRSAPFVLPTPFKGGSLKSSKMTKFIGHRSIGSGDHRIKTRLEASLSPDGTSLVVWCESKIRRLALSGAARDWGEDHLLRRIVLAAAGRSHFAAVSRETNGYQLLLFDNDGSPFGQATMPLPEYAYSMTFSNDGSSLAIAMRNEVRIIATDLEDWALEGRYTQLELHKEHERRNEAQPTRRDSSPGRPGDKDVHSQTISFSPDLCRLLVATQVSDRAGTTRMSLFDISQSAGRRRIKVVQKEIPRGSSDIGLFATACSHSSDPADRTSMLIGADTPRNQQLSVQTVHPKDEQGKRQLVLESITSKASLEMKNVHAAMAIDGTTQRFAVVTDDDKVMLLQRQPGGVGSWLAKAIDVHLHRQKNTDEDKRQRVKMAASSASEMKFFYISNGQGWVVTYDGSATQQAPPQQVKLDSFHQ